MGIPLLPRLPTYDNKVLGWYQRTIDILQVGSLFRVSTAQRPIGLRLLSRQRFVAAMDGRRRSASS